MEKTKNCEQKWGEEPAIEGENVRGLRLGNKDDKHKNCNKDRIKDYIGRVFPLQ